MGRPLASLSDARSDARLDLVDLVETLRGEPSWQDLKMDVVQFTTLPGGQGNVVIPETIEPVWIAGTYVLHLPWDVMSFYEASWRTLAAYLGRSDSFPGKGGKVREVIAAIEALVSAYDLKRIGEALPKPTVSTPKPKKTRPWAAIIAVIASVAALSYVATR